VCLVYNENADILHQWVTLCTPNECSVCKQHDPPPWGLAPSCCVADILPDTGAVEFECDAL
jgi:hypothetical protein